MTAARIAAIALSAATAAHAAAAELLIENAWIRAPVAGRTVAAGYCEIANRGADAVTIVGFAAADAADAEGAVGTVGTVEMHETVLRDGMARMRPLPALELAPGQRVVLEPGGKHLMLFNFTATEPTVVLHALGADGSRVAASFAVRRRNGTNR